MRKYSFIQKLLVYTSIISTTAAYAQTSYHISIAHGLSTNNLTAVIRSKSNYMWSASYNGLNKHEGSSIRVYNRIGKDSTSLSSGEIHTVFEDKQGFIWMGTTGGVDRLDPRTNLIRHFTLRSGTKQSSLGYIYSIFQDQQDQLWVSTDVALFCMNAITGEYKQIPISKNRIGVPSPVISYKGGISTIKGLWMNTADGLAFFDYASGNFYHRYHNPANLQVLSIGRRQGQSAPGELAADKNGNLYFVSVSQLIKYNAETQQLDSFAFQFPANAWKCCYSMATDQQNNVWIGFRHGGLLFFDVKTKRFTPILHKGINSLIQSNYIYSIAEDYLGMLWVTTDNGIDVIDWYNRAVQQTWLSDDPDFLKLNHPSGMMSYDNNRYLYIPFFKGGLFRYDIRNNELGHFRITDSTEQHISFADIRKDGSLWFGNTRTLSKASLAGSSIRYDRQKDLLAERLRTTSSSITSIIRGNNNEAYIKKVNGVIYHFDGKDSLQKIPAYGFMRQMAMSKDSQHLLYIDPNLDVIKRSLNSGKIETFRISEKLQHAKFHYFNPRDIAEDKNGNIWIASQNGVIRYDAKSDSTYVYTTMQGLSNNFTYALCIDQKNRIWIASLGGIDWFDKDNNIFRNVVRSPASTYMDSYGSSAETNDGNIFFLAGNKLFRIHPELYFAQTNHIKQLALHELQVNGIASNPLDSNNLQHLPYDQNRIAFRFGLMDFIPDKTNRYYYRLEGVDNDWIENHDQSMVSYNALPPGNFKLHIKATDASGKLIGKEQLVPFTIQAPFWKTTWFRLLAAATVAAVFYLMYRYQQRKQREKQLQKMLMAESRFMNLRLQMNPHFLFNSLNSIQHLVVTKQHAEAYQYLTLFSHLLRSVLQYAERDFISLDTELDMLKMYLKLEAMRFKGSFQYEIIVDETLDQEEVMVPSLLVQPFAENAIWHGLLKKEGDQRLTISFSSADECLTCRVTDNGIGREKAAALKQQQVDIPSYESKGIRIVKERLGLLEQRTGKKSGITVTDLFTENGERHAAGTMVEISIPFYYSEEYDQSAIRGR